MFFISILMLIIAVAIMAVRPQYRHVSFGLVLGAAFLFILAVI